MPLPLSLSSRRAWIEIRCCFDKLVKVMSLSSRRAWIEIWVSEHLPEVTSGRSPHGERGLKSTAGFDFGKSVGVALLTESVD